MASCSEDQSIIIWDILKLIALKKLTGHIPGILYFLEFQNGYLISSDWSKNLRIWNVNSGENVKSIRFSDSESFCLILLNNGTIIAALADGTIRFINI